LESVLLNIFNDGLKREIYKGGGVGSSDLSIRQKAG
jgi:hypothetical protein